MAELVNKGMMQDRNAIKVCSTAGIAAIEGKLATFRQLRTSLIAAIAEAEKDAQNARQWDKYLLAAKLVKGACDGILGVAGEFTGPWGKALKETYKAGSTIGDAATRKALGQDVSLAKTATSVAFNAVGAARGVAKGQNEAVKNGIFNPAGKSLEERLVRNSSTVQNIEKRVFNTPVTSDRIKNLSDRAETLKKVNTAAKAGKVPTETIIASVNSDEKYLNRTVFVNMISDLGSLSADAAEELTDSKIGKAQANRVGRIFSAGKDLMNSSLAMYDAYEQFKKDDSSSGIKGAQKSLKTQLTSIEKKLETLHSLLSDCESQTLFLT